MKTKTEIALLCFNMLDCTWRLRWGRTRICHKSKDIHFWLSHWVRERYSKYSSHTFLRVLIILLSKSGHAKDTLTRMLEVHPPAKSEILHTLGFLASLLRDLPPGLQTETKPAGYLDCFLIDLSSEITLFIVLCKMFGCHSKSLLLLLHWMLQYCYCLFCYFLQANSYFLECLLFALKLECLLWQFGLHS